MGGVFFEGWLSLDSLLGSTISFSPNIEAIFCLRNKYFQADFPREISLK